MKGCQVYSSNILEKFLSPPIEKILKLSRIQHILDQGIFPQFGIRFIAGWSSPVAREAHNLEVAGSNPVPAIFLAPSC